MERLGSVEAEHTQIAQSEQGILYLVLRQNVGRHQDQLNYAFWRCRLMRHFAGITVKHERQDGCCPRRDCGLHLFGSMV